VAFQSRIGYEMKSWTNARSSRSTGGRAYSIAGTALTIAKVTLSLGFFIFRGSCLQPNSEFGLRHAFRPAGKFRLVQRASNGSWTRKARRIRFRNCNAAATTWPSDRAKTADWAVLRGGNADFAGAAPVSGGMHA
jgi:hypothetical protein